MQLHTEATYARLPGLVGISVLLAYICNRPVSIFIMLTGISYMRGSNFSVLSSLRIRS
jgi:hypothetical protein